MAASAPALADVSTTNQRFYDALWAGSELLPPDKFNTWPLVSALANSARRRLELGPGLRPRLPIGGSYFVDTSRRAIARLNASGASGITARATALPFADGYFDLVCAFDVIEHIDDDAQVFAEISRVLKDGGTLAFSVPLHSASWTEFDTLVGHCRRYDPHDLLCRLDDHALVLERSAPFGMQPRSRLLVDFGLWMLRHHRAWAVRWYNHFLPWAIAFQRPLAFVPRFIDATGVDEAALVCRRQRRARSQ